MSPQSHAAFPPTRWSIVLAAREGGDVRAGRRALEDLCRIYWQPVYGFARRRGCTPADAEDLVQGFFARLLKDGLFERADAATGRLRSFLLGAFQRYQREEWRKAQAEKRGAGEAALSLDVEDAEQIFQLDDGGANSPEAYFEKQCALALLDTAINKLADEQTALGKGEAFTLLRPLLSPAEGSDENHTHDHIAKVLGMTVEASRAAIYRLRKRFREMLRDAVAETLDEPTPESVDEELLALRRALG